MKSSRALVLALSSLSAASAFAGVPVSKCRIVVSDPANGAMLASRDAHVRFGKADLIEVGAPKFASFRLKIAEYRNSPDTFLYGAEASELPKRAYFNETGAGALGGAFGNGKIFGTVSCENPKEVPFYYSSRDGKIMLEDDQRASLNGMLFAGGCIGGDLDAAIKDLGRYWYNSVENGSMRVVSHAFVEADGAKRKKFVEWTEIHRSCLQEVDNGGDLPTPTSCVKWAEPTRFTRMAPACAD